MNPQNCTALLKPYVEAVCLASPNADRVVIGRASACFHPSRSMQEQTLTSCQGVGLVGARGAAPGMLRN